MVAGARETTRNAMAHGMLPFLDHPEQRELLKATCPATAADDIVRWATPISVIQRTATRDTILGGQQVTAGQRVGLFYRSAPTRRSSPSPAGIVFQRVRSLSRHFTPSG